MSQEISFPCALSLNLALQCSSGSAGVATVTQRRNRGEIRYPRSKEKQGIRLDTEQLHQNKAQEPLPEPQQLKGLGCTGCSTLQPQCVRAATRAPKACSAHLGIEKT